jgi:hypothetical protein
MQNTRNAARSTHTVLRALISGHQQDEANHLAAEERERLGPDLRISKTGFQSAVQRGQ